MEDQENWHGKPLGKNSAAALEAVKKAIVNPGPHGITPQPFVDDCPKVEFPEVKLSEPPNYEKGATVSPFNIVAPKLLIRNVYTRLPPEWLMVLLLLKSAQTTHVYMHLMLIQRIPLTL